MSKQIVRDQEIYLAPGILGKFKNGRPVAIDERNDNAILDPRDLDDKITIYEREVQEWFLKRAHHLLNSNTFDNSFIVLMVCMSYLEGVEQYKTGVSSNGRSKEFFVNSINRIYPNFFQARDLKKLYTKTRCGLFHNGMVQGGVIFNNSFLIPIEFMNNGESIRINPRLLLQDIMNDYSSYINKLRSNNSESTTVLRENFDRMFAVL